MHLVNVAACLFLGRLTNCMSVGCGRRLVWVLLRDPLYDQPVMRIVAHFGVVSTIVEDTIQPSVAKAPWSAHSQPST